MFGFYKADDESSFEIINEGDEENEYINHPIDEMRPLFELKEIESSENMVKVTFVAKEIGFYKIVLSNSHSWLRAKTLKFRYVVLKPVVQTPALNTQSNEEETADKKEEKNEKK